MDSLEKIITKKINERLQMAEQKHINEMKKMDSEDIKVLNEHFSKNQIDSNKTESNDNDEATLMIKKPDLKSLASEIDDCCSDNESDMNLEFNKTKLFAEAFAGDDAVEEFAKHENNTNKYNKELLNFIPGWNIWSGHDILHDNKTKRKMVKQMEKQEKRKNAFIYNAIKKEPYEKISSKQKVNFIAFNKLNV